MTLFKKLAGKASALLNASCSCSNNCIDGHCSGRNILSPARMASMAYADGGTVESYYLCKTCDTIVSHMRWGDEYGFGELREEALKMEREAYQCD